MPYCRKCDRSFGSKHALKQHQNSSVHRGSKCNHYPQTRTARNGYRVDSSAHSKRVRCLGARCRRQFKSWSAMIQHFESGACRSGMNRNLVDMVAIAVDQNHSFSVGGGQIMLPLPDPGVKRIVEVDDGGEAGGELSGGDAGAPTAALSTSSSGIILTPVTEPSVFQSLATPSTVIFTPQTPLQGRHSGVDAQALAESLERLIPRIIFAPPIYFCPFPHCVSAGKIFSSLGGLFQHMESRRCRGSPQKLTQLLQRKLRSIQY